MRSEQIVEQFREHLEVEKLTQYGNGCRLINFSFNAENDEGFYSGYIQVGFGKIKEARFKILAEIPKSLITSYEVSRKMTTKNLVKLIGFGTNLVEVGKDLVVVAYDTFDYAYKTWAKLNVASMDGAWWVLQIPKILDTINVMKNYRIFHGALDRLESYVTTEGNLSIIDFGIVLEASNTLEAREYEKKDLLALRKFLESEVKGFPDQPLWDHFLTSFDHFTANQLRKHPIMLQSLERYNYLCDLTDLVRNHMDVADRAKFIGSLRSGSDEYYLGWGNFNCGSIFYHTLHYSGSGSAARDSFTLLQYIETFIDHFEQNATTLNLQFTDLEMVESSISSQFPLFLSRLHFTVVTHSTPFEVTGYHSHFIDDI